MVKGVLDYTTSSNDFYTLFDNMVATNPHLEKTITEVRNETNLFLVKVLRFYTMRDLAYVLELDSGDEYYCHMTHEMLSHEVSINCMCDGSVKSDVKYGVYVKPTSDIYGIVANVRFEGIDDKKCLLACLNFGDDNRLKSNVRNGEIRLASGNSTLSITKERINLITPRLFVNGLPYDEPKLANYYDKTEVSTTISLLKEDLETQVKELDDNLFDKIYPVGSIYMSMNSADPSTLFGGEWERLKDTFLLASGDTYDADGMDKSTAQHGEATHTLTVDEMPKHKHDLSYRTGVIQTGSSGTYYFDVGTSGNWYTNSPSFKESGGNNAHNNMPPYLAVYMWKRTG